MLLVSVLCFNLSHSKIIKDFKVHDDDHDQIFLESFGFTAGGVMNLKINNFKVCAPHIKLASHINIYLSSFFLFKLIGSMQPENQDDTTNTLKFFVLKVTEIDIAEFEDREIKDWFCSSKSIDNSEFGSKIKWYVHTLHAHS